MPKGNPNASLGEAVLKLVADKTPLIKDVQSAGNEVAGQLGTIGQAIKAALPVAMLLGAAVAAIKGIGDAIKVAGAEEAEMAVLGQAIQNTGVNFEQIKGSVTGALNAMSMTSGFMKGDLEPALTRLTVSSGDYNRAMQLLPLAMDMARGRGMDLVNTSMILGKVAEGNVRILTRYGIVLDKNATSTQALAILQTRFGGMADAYVRTYVGSMDRMAAAQNIFQEAIGSAVLPLLTQFNNAVVDIALATLPGLISAMEGVSEVSQVISYVFSGLVGDMFAWGQSLITDFANGIASGMGPVAQALQMIGDMIASWLQPGSPPRLLPQITQWGAGAATAYMDGWKQADFSAFNDMAGTVEGALKALGDAGKIAAQDVIPLTIKAQTQLARIWQEIRTTGNYTEESMAKLSKTLGKSAPAVKGLVDAYRDLYNATAAETKAQKELDALGREESAVDRAQRKKELSYIINAAEYSAYEKEKARLELKKLDLEQTKENAGVAKDAAQEKIDAIKGQYDFEIKQGNQVAQQISQMEQLANTYKRIADQQKRAAEAAQRAAEQLYEAQLEYRLALVDTEGKLAIWNEELAKTEKGSLKYWQILTKISGLEKQLAKERGAASKGGAGVLPEPKKKEMPKPLMSPEEIQAKITQYMAMFPVIGRIITWVTEHSLALKGAVLGVAAAIAAPVIWGAIMGIIGLIGTLVAAISWPIVLIALLGAAIATNFGGLGDVFRSVCATLLTTWQAVWPIIQTTFQNVWAIIQNTLAIIMPKIEAIVQALGPSISQAVAMFGVIFTQVMAAVGPAITTVAAFIGEKVVLIVSLIEANMPLIQQTITTVLNAIQAIWNVVWPAIQATIEYVWPYIKSIVNDVIMAIWNIIKAVMQAINGDWEGAWESVKLALSTAWDAIILLIEGALGGIVTLVANLWPTMLTDLQGWWTSFQNWIGNLDVKQLGLDILNGLIAGIDAGVELLHQAANRIAASVTSAFRNAFGMHSPSAVFSDIGTGLIQGLNQGLDGAQVSIDRVAESTMTDAESAFQTGMSACNKLVTDGWALMTTNTQVALNGVLTEVNGQIVPLTTAIETPYKVSDTDLRLLFASFLVALGSAGGGAGFLYNVWSAFSNAITPISTAMKQPYQDALDAIGPILTALLGSIKDSPNGFLPSVVTAATAQYQAIRDALEAPFKDAQTTINAILDAVTRKLQQIRDKVSQAQVAAGSPAAAPAAAAQNGLDAWYNKPTTILVGEGGLEHVRVTPYVQGQGTGAEGVTVNINIANMEKELTPAYLEYLAYRIGDLLQRRARYAS